jgi:DNA-binding response OmpR family regulator
MLEIVRLKLISATVRHRDGIEVLREIRKKDSDMVIIMFTADPSIVRRGLSHRRCELLLS